MKQFLIGSLSTLLFIVGTYLASPPLLAQFDDIRQHLNSLPTKRVEFKKETTGTTIHNAESTIYILGAKAGQTLTLKYNSLGGPASVTLYGVDGKPLNTVIGTEDYSQPFSIRLPATGDYYIVGGSGVSNATYIFTVTIR
ncbi:hypothetical protein [Chroococcus sp. FPU101]|uniref:hypothetical protein n=1 Tax=Chroococcus sp. FPU101 TaxID=1974212 RepID=UPI001A904E86|nr:hypothetical protein [Chroococcus sp. FPU101]GFE70075.1 hypothetical protein CFPU101_26850 [Chroococcus sp. FPU101]